MSLLRHWRVFLALGILLPFAMTAGLAQEAPEKDAAPPRFDSVTSAMDAIRASNDYPPSIKIYEQISSLPIVSEAEMLAVYGEMKALEKAYSDVEQGEQLIKRMHFLSVAIHRCTDTQCHPWVTRLLEKEYEALPRWDWSWLRGDDKAEAMKQALRLGPAVALIHSASAGKITAALPILRKLREKGGDLGQLAEMKLAELGDLQDLDWAIEQIKKNPKARPALRRYGDAVVPRLMKEVDDPATSAQARHELALRLGLVARPGNCNLYIPLFDHRLEVVRRNAKGALASCLSSADEELARKLLRNPDRDIRFNALMAVGERVWNESFIPDLLEILRYDSDPDLRSNAALILGRKGVHHAADDLKQSLSDPSGWVRSAVRGALQALEEEAAKP